MRNERTSRSVSRLAGFLLSALADDSDGEFMMVGNRRVVSVGIVKKICASALTQSPDRPTEPTLTHKSKGVPASQIRKVAAKRKGKR